MPLPVYSDIVIFPVQIVQRGSIIRSSLIDIRKVTSLRVILKIGRGGTTVIGTAPVMYTTERQASEQPWMPGMNRPAGAIHTGTTTAANGSSTISVDAAAGDTVITVASGAGFAIGDSICIQDGGSGLARLEWARVQNVVGNVLTLLNGLQFAHSAAQNDTVRNKADLLSATVSLGNVNEFAFDYLTAATGEALTIHAVGTATVST